MANTPKELEIIEELKTFSSAVINGINDDAGNVHEGMYQSIIKVSADALEQEFQKGRITGIDYATAYTTIIQNALQQAIQYKLQSAIQEAQAELLKLQVKVAEKDIIKADAEIKLMEAKAANEVLQGCVITEQCNALKKEQILTDVKIVNENLQTCIVTEQCNKIKQETSLLANKTETEYAQTHDTNSAGGDITGVLGKQRDLYEKQKEGFLRDAEQKLAKLLADSFAVQRSTDEAISPRTTGLDNANIREALKIAFDGVGATQQPIPPP